MEKIENKVHNTEILVLFGTWLIKKGDIGYGLLNIIAPILAIKNGNLLDYKWGDFINPLTNKCEESIQVITNKEEYTSRELNMYLQTIITQVYEQNLGKDGFRPQDSIFTNTRTGKVLTTATLKRELQRLFEGFEKDVKYITYLKMNFKPIETNSFEIAWGRDMARLFNYSKKVLIEISKFLGHQTLKHTIQYLEVPMIDEVKLRFDLYSPDIQNTISIYDNIEDFDWLSRYLLKNKLAETTDEYIEQVKENRARRKATQENK